MHSIHRRLRAWALAAGAGVWLTACAHRAPTPPTAPAAPVADPLGAATSDAAYLRSRALIVPVSGVTPDRVPDTFNARRGSRTHRAVDIDAPRGTPVLAADDGRVLRLRSNALGGITIYETDPERRLVYYYAHLERYARGLAEGAKLAKGQVIGYVGTTGNAPKNEPHLHFQVMRLSPRRRYWDGIPLDPRPYFVRRAGTP